MPISKGPSPKNLAETRKEVRSSKAQGKRDVTKAKEKPPHSGPRMPKKKKK